MTIGDLIHVWLLMYAGVGAIAATMGAVIGYRTAGALLGELRAMIASHPEIGEGALRSSYESRLVIGTVRLPVGATICIVLVVIALATKGSSLGLLSSSALICIWAYSIYQLAKWILIVARLSRARSGVEAAEHG